MANDTAEATKAHPDGLPLREADNIDEMYLTFALGAEEYGVNIAGVTEIVGMQRIMSVPDVPHYIKGVINLRGNRADCGADALSRAEAARLGLAHIDAPFESRGAPHKDRILRLAAIFQDMHEPALIHCKSGADRTGLAAGLWLMLQGRPVAEALAQLSLRHGHVAASRTGILDAFFKSFAAFQQANPEIPFLEWVQGTYDEAALRESFSSNLWADRLVDQVLRRE
jgi:protein tyrosine phosphatase (PTP) superfamily phosphohydrolase (DUF442 family)